MRETVFLLGLVGMCRCAATASGQAAVTIEADADELRPGESTVVTLHAAFPASEFVFGNIITDLLSSTGSTGWSDFELTQTLRAPGTSPGTPTGEGIERIIAAQQYFPIAGPWPDLRNPIPLWQATYTAPTDVAAPFDLVLSTRTTRFETYISIDESTLRSHLDGLAEGETTIRVVPSPAPLALLVLGGAAATRRRRLESRSEVNPPSAPPPASSSPA